MVLKEPLTESYFYILLCLYDGPKHGYGIMQQTKELSCGRVKIGSGTMYGATGNMMKKGWIEECLDPADGERRRCYRLTDEGRSVLQAECGRIRELLNNAERLMGGNKL